MLRLVTRRRLTVAVGAAFIAGAVVWSWAMVKWERVTFTPDVAARIQPGMSRAEVEAILDGPKGNYGNKIFSPPSNSFWPRNVTRGCRLDCWWDNEGMIEVWFDPSDHVCDVGFIEYTNVAPLLQQSFLDRLRRLLGW